MLARCRGGETCSEVGDFLLLDWLIILMSLALLFDQGIVSRVDTSLRRSTYNGACSSCTVSMRGKPVRPRSIARRCLALRGGGAGGPLHAVATANSPGATEVSFALSIATRM